MTAQPVPDFIIIGSPKCGTTALSAYLDQSPDIYIPPIKEPHFFCEDFDKLRRIRTRFDYLSLYGSTTADQKTGDASVWYLYSKNAAEFAARFVPEARIIVMFRDPVEMLPSLHSQLVFSGRETAKTFGEAWKLIPERKAGQSLPNSVVEPSHLFYDEVCSYWTQLQRWRAVFPDQQILVIDFEDFRADPGAVTRRVFKFLEVVPPSNLNTKPVNQARVHRFPRLSAILRNPPFPLNHLKVAIKKVPWIRANPPLRRVYAAMSLKRNSAPLADPIRQDIRSTYRIEMESIRAYAERGGDEARS